MYDDPFRHNIVDIGVVVAVARRRFHALGKAAVVVQHSEQVGQIALSVAHLAPGPRVEIIVRLRL